MDGKVVVHEDDLLVAMLRFGENAIIHEHPGETDTIVACIEGEGLTNGPPSEQPPLCNSLLQSSLRPARQTRLEARPSFSCSA